VPQLDGDEAAQQHLSALKRLLSQLSPEEKEIILAEIRYKANLLQENENLFFRDLMEQRVMVSVRTTRGTIVNIAGKNWNTQRN
jgi:hypothetical protein